ncbi:MAG: dockerin type I domain-containing protein [Candidatus Roizmanbacteria bacterium]|nr:dockerin type I domain-containing protein [Candidatus Roizmanbacteria bacterium]
MRQPMIKHHHKNESHHLAFDIVVYFVVPLVLILIALRIDSARFLFTTKGAEATITATLGNDPINTQVNTTIPVPLQLSASADNKISGTELYVMFNTDGSNTLTFDGYADTTGTFTKEVIKEVRDFNSMKLLHLVLIADKKKGDLSSQALLTLRFKANKNGTDTITFLTQESSIVGPISGIQYTITPENEAHTTIVVSDSAPSPTTAAQVTPTTTPATGTTPTTAPTTAPAATTTPSPTLGVSPTASAQATATPAPTTQPTATPTPTPTPSPTPRPTATPTLAPTATPTSAPHAIQVNLSVRFQGITKKPIATYCQNKKVKVTIKGSSLSQPKVLNDIVVTANNQGIYTGSFSLTDIQAGNNYTMAIKGPQHLQRVFTGANFQLGENTANLTTTPLFVGDFPLQDGVLNQQDVQFLKSRVLSSQENQAADVNCDGVVNGNDYSLLIESMKIKYDDEQ